MANGLDNPNKRDVPDDGLDALSALSMSAGKKVQEYLGTAGGTFVPPVNLARVVGEAMGVEKDSQEALAAGNEISSLALAKGKDKYDGKKWSQVIGKHFGIASAWKSVGMSLEGVDFSKQPVCWQGPDGDTMHGKVLGMHKKTPKGLSADYAHDEPSKDSPVAKVQVHEADAEGDLKPTHKHVAVQASKLKSANFSFAWLTPEEAALFVAKSKEVAPADDDDSQVEPPAKKGAKPAADAADAEDDSETDDSSSAPDSSLSSSEEAAEEAASKKQFSLDEFDLEAIAATPPVSYFSKLTKADRDKLDVREFGDPDRRLFPITDQDDVHSAAHLIGKAADPEKVKHNIKTIARRKGFNVPDAWKDKDEDCNMSAEFSLDGANVTAPDKQDGMIVREAPILFRCDDYPDKQFSLSPEEAMAAVADFKPVELDLEHKPTVLNGKLGSLTAVSQSPQDPYLLSGQVTMPKWLDDLIPPDAKKLSLAFNRLSKKIIGCSLVRTPRVSDAALMAAFAATHPLTVEEKVTTTPTQVSPAPAPATPPSPSAPAAAAAPTQPSPAASPVPAATFSLDKIPGLTAQRLKEIENSATEFARIEVHAERATPAAQPVLAGQYRQAALDDMAMPYPVVFADGVQMSRVEALRRSQSLVEPHKLTTEVAPVAPAGQVLFNQQQTQLTREGTPMSEDRRKELLGRTTVGRSVLTSTQK